MGFYTVLVEPVILPPPGEKEGGKGRERRKGKKKKETHRNNKPHTTTHPTSWSSCKQILAHLCLTFVARLDTR